MPTPWRTIVSTARRTGAADPPWLVAAPRVAAILCCLGGLGCGKRPPQTFPTSGRVTIEKRPAIGFTVEFSSQAPETRGLSASGIVTADGGFTLRTRFAGKPRDGAVAGPHRVVVVPPPAAVQAGPVAPVPLRYADYLTSGLTAEVVAGGSNSIILELER